MKTFLITGGAGFIGSIISRILSQKHKVVIYDAFIQYISPLKSYYQTYLDKRFEVKDSNNPMLE